ncbi:hypothetical protein AB6A40_003310 [Gnathostoma spinigerum]|uniref:Phospholipid/glycerol acyltransferase domain-containing protein n=1 Tax=Gnathostoma spinigerum TaxID=75299 RepID=A0ABD6EGU4_9BILA
MIANGSGGLGIDVPTVSMEDNSTTNTTNGLMELKKVMALFGAVYWFIMTVFVVPMAVVASYLTILTPLRLINVKWHNAVEHRMCKMVNDHWASAAVCCGMNVIEYGDDINKISDARTLFLANHLGLLDHFVLMCAMSNKGLAAGRYLWVIFNIWKMTTLGVMWLVHGNFFINGGASRRKQVLEEFKVYLTNNYWKYDYRWIVMYPEGSRLYLIKESNAKYAAKTGQPIFKHCALPRSGAAHAVLDVAGKARGIEEMGEGSLAVCGMGGPIEYVVDSTIGYKNGDVPSLMKAMLGEYPNNQSTISVYYRIYQTRPEWSEENVLRKWLCDRYAEKDKLLDYYYENGRFPTDRMHARRLYFPLSQSIIAEMFWLGLYYIHHVLWIKLLTLYLFRLVTSLLF